VEKSAFFYPYPTLEPVHSCLSPITVEVRAPEHGPGGLLPDSLALVIFARPNSKAAPRKAFRRRRWLRVLAAFLLFAPLAVHALEPTTPLANYARQSWVMENGLLQNTIHALAQTSDGFIWLGTEVGLAPSTATTSPFTTETRPRRCPTPTSAAFLLPKTAPSGSAPATASPAGKTAPSPPSRRKTGCRET